MAANSCLPEDSPIRRNDGSPQPSGTDALYSAVKQLVAMPVDERQSIFTARRERLGGQLKIYKGDY